MKCLNNLKRIGVGLCLLSLATVSNAQIVTLTSGNSSAQVNVGSPAGMFNWTVDNVNQLNTQWFWYRLGGAGGEVPINTIGAPAVVLTGANQLTTTYLNPNNLFSVVVDYKLTGGSLGSGASGIDEVIRVNNLGANPLSFHFFQYSDFDLGGTTLDASVFLDRSEISGVWRAAFQDGDVSLTETLETGNAPGANHGQAGFFPDILTSLNDGSPTTLTDAAGPVGPGNLTWAFQWDTEIAPGGTFIISKTKTLQVPEPGTAAVFALGLIALALRRRNS